MGRTYVFADEAGNFDFSRSRGASQYFILTSVTMEDCSAGDALMDLRRDLAWRGVQLLDEFHATSDAQAVRDEVFALIARHNFRVDATILEKAKIEPGPRQDEPRFYQMAWYLHMRHLTLPLANDDDDLLVVGASLGTRRKRALFAKAIEDVMQQTAPSILWRTATWSSACEPCLQVADYCSWAIQRKWERGDSRSYILIQDKIKTEYDAFQGREKLYY